MTEDPKQLAFWPGRYYDQRLELRLDSERRRKLAEIAQARGVPLSQVVRDLIDRAYEEQEADDGRETP